MSAYSSHSYYYRITNTACQHIHVYHPQQELLQKLVICLFPSTTHFFLLQTLTVPSTNAASEYLHIWYS